MPFKDHAEYLAYQRKYARAGENKKRTAVRMAKYRQRIKRAEMWWTQLLLSGKAAPQLLEGLSQTVIDRAEENVRRKFES